MSEELDERCIEKVAAIFRSFGHPLRLRIVKQLKDGPANVGELTEKLNSSQANVSKHLKLLFENKIVAREKDGTQNIYSLASQDVIEICRCSCDYVKKSMANQSKIREHLEKEMF